MGAQKGDLMFLLSGDTDKVRKQMNELRLEIGQQLGLRDPKVFAPLWVVDFPLLEWDEETQRYHAMHHLLLHQSQTISPNSIPTQLQ
jgi:aspartyl-tRNA synthetase